MGSDDNFSAGEDHFTKRFGIVAIAGVGLIGGSLGMALKSQELAERVIGIGRDEGRLGKAIALGAIDIATLSFSEGVADADLVILCSTVSHILEMVPQAIRGVKQGAVVTDVGSTKAAIVSSAANFSGFVGSHPMAGSERGGVDAASITLFKSATWAITPSAHTDPRALETVRFLAEAMGSNTLIVSPETHDAMVAITSHLPHVMASALMRQASLARAVHRDIPRLAAGSFADATRVAASSPEIWRDVCLTNREAVLNALNEFRGQLEILEEAVAAQDAAAIEAFFAAGSTAKREWME